MKPRLLSGIQPTGTLHIGNWLGAIENWVKLQETHDCVFSIVDLHAITAEYAPSEMQPRILEVATTLLACGIDPARSILFVQSRLPEHAELAWLLNCVTPIGDLERMTQFKEKSEEAKGSVSAGLLNYPILQAADILLYRAQAVPVGQDQLQHLELTREIARRFNARFGETFPEPRPLVGRGARILGLDGKRKMSKSLGNHLAIVERPEEIWKRLAPAVTDENRKRRSDPGNPEVCNIFSWHKLFSTAERIAEVDRECRVAGIGCLDCKRWLADAMERALGPVRARYEALAADPACVREALADGARRASAVARETISLAKRRMGLAG